MSHLAKLHAFSFIIHEPAAGSALAGSTQKQQEELILSVIMETLGLVSYLRCASSFPLHEVILLELIVGVVLVPRLQEVEPAVERRRGE